MTWASSTNRWVSTPTTADCRTRGANCSPSPRLGLSEGEYDEGEILENFIQGLGGLFYRDERALVRKGPR